MRMFGTTRGVLAKAAIALLVAASGLAPAEARDPASQPGDGAMTCPQLVDAINQQNAEMKKQHDRYDYLMNKPVDAGDADPKPLERLAQIKADKAKSRADALLAVGQEKKCFK